jgi:nucleotide-binding universal stress UspA family protein
MMYRRILIALEGRRTDEAVLAHAEELAAQMNAEVTLLRVIAVADDGGGGLGRQFQTEVGSSGWRRKNEAETHLSQLAARLRRAGLCAETALVVGTKSEGDEIVVYARENGFDLIAMARDSQPWYKRLLRSPQDDDVLRKATVPTLFVGDGKRKIKAQRGVPRPNPAMAILGSADL